MRKFLIPLAAFLAGSAPAIAQEALSPEDQAFEQLLNQYATVTLGLGIDQRCRQLYPKAADLFAENHAIVKSFMATIMPAEAFEQLNTGIQEAANDEVANPCGSYTFDFIQASAQISSTMAYRINILQGKTEPEPGMTPPAVSPPPVAQEAIAEPQETEAVPVQEPVKEPVQEPVKVESQETKVEPVQEPVQETVPPPQPEAQEVKTETPSSSPARPETKKERNRRQREEVRALNRKHREERDNFKASQGTYPDPKAAKKALQGRQDAELDAMRQRHFEEDRAGRNR
ncbi:MAG: hypothetical protein IH901_01320 [Proteobacteria bacterium]|nr:hypothetical protein [Pseudomonadota bacterium]